MRQIIVDKDRCTLCEICISVCPFGALALAGDEIEVTESCNLCGACVPECPAEAIEVTGPAPEEVDLSGWRGIWVFAEQTDGRLAGVVFELLSEARRMAAVTGEEVSAVLAGEGTRDLQPELIAHGADRVYVAEDSVLASFRDETYVTVIASLVEQHQPSVILFGATARGRSLAPRLAARLGTGLTADCTELDIDETGLLIQTRPAFGGNIMATIVCRRHRPQMATVRPRILQADAPDYDREGEIVDVPVDGPALQVRTLLLEAVEEEQGIMIEDADIIVAGGRGLGGPEGFEILFDLAKTLGGAVGVSRPVVDAGWVPYIHQVGQTGKTVSPSIYIACGISGAVQHMAGMRSADTIIAINKNPDAPIFNVATYGLVGDLFQIIPNLKREITNARR